MAVQLTNDGVVCYDTDVRDAKKIKVDEKLQL